MITTFLGLYVFICYRLIYDSGLGKGLMIDLLCFLKFFCNVNWIPLLRVSFSSEGLLKLDMKKKKKNGFDGELFKNIY